MVMPSYTQSCLCLHRCLGVGITWWRRWRLQRSHTPACCLATEHSLDFGGGSSSFVVGGTERLRLDHQVCRHAFQLDAELGA